MRCARYSLRLLLLAVILICLPLAWIAKQQSEVRERQAVLAEVRLLGGDYGLKQAELKSFRLRFQRDWLGDDSINVRWISLSLSSSVDDPFLARLKVFPHLHGLDLSDTSIGDEGVRHLASIPELTHVALGRTKITSQAIASLVCLRELEWLEVEDTHVDDSIWEYVAQMKELKSLARRNTLAVGGYSQVGPLGDPYGFGPIHLDIPAESLDMNFGGKYERTRLLHRRNGDVNDPSERERLIREALSDRHIEVRIEGVRCIDILHGGGYDWNEALLAECLRSQDDRVVETVFFYQQLPDSERIMEALLEGPLACDNPALHERALGAFNIMGGVPPESIRKRLLAIRERLSDDGIDKEVFGWHHNSNRQRLDFLFEEWEAASEK